MILLLYTCAVWLVWNGVHYAGWLRGFAGGPGGRSASGGQGVKFNGDGRKISWEGVDGGPERGRSIPKDQERK